jgi:AraC-like DNA-binding protein
MTPRIANHSDFAARLDHTAIERLALNQVQAPAHGVARTAHDLARGGPGLVFLNLHPTGRCRVLQGGRDHRARAGELMLIDSREPYVIDLVDPGRLLSLALPAELLKPWVTDLEDLAARPLHPSPAAQLLRAHIQALAACAQDLDESQAGVVADTTVALARSALTPPAEAARMQPSLRRRVQVLIAQHAHDAGFGPVQAAALLAVSVRQLHATMAAGGTTFCTEQMEYRLQRARALLMRASGLPGVAGVARACGFASAEHFSRRFRVRFGCTPISCIHGNRH